MIIICESLNPLTKGCFVPSLVEIGLVVLKKKIFKCCQCIFAISLSSSLEKGWGHSFEQAWVLITQECFVPSLVVIGPVILEKKIFKVRQHIYYFVIISPWKEAGSLIRINMNPHHQRMLCAKFGWNRPSGS